MKLFLQESSDGSHWTTVPDLSFRGKAHAALYLDERFPTNNLLDWRVGFLLVTRHGCEGKPPQYLRVVDKHGKLVK